MPHYFNREDIGMIIADCRKICGLGTAGQEKMSCLDQLVMDDAVPGQIQMPYVAESVDLVQAIELAVIHHYNLVEEKKINIQFHAPPFCPALYLDNFFLNQVFAFFFSALVELTEAGNTIAVYLINTDGRCIAETVSYGRNNMLPVPDDYFKKHRISNAFQKPVEKTTDLYALYQYIIADMGGELLYDFSRERNNYFRIKFSSGGG